MKGGVEGDAEGEAGAVVGFVGFECDIGSAVGIPVVNMPPVLAAPGAILIEG